MNPVLRYMRARLHRRLFLWFGVTILLTVVVAGGIFWSGGSKWNDYGERITTFVGGRFAHVWDDPVERDEFASSAASDLGVDVILLDDTGAELGRFGEGCGGPWFNVAVYDGTARLGTVRACPRDLPKSGPFPGALALGVAGLVLWVSSGAIAYRVTRPLVQLVKVTKDIGEGKLDARLRLGRRMGHGEFAVLAAAVNEMAERIQKQMSDQRELLAAVSHEIRTPLGHLRVLLDLVRESGTDPKLVNELEREVLACDAMVDQLLANSRVEFGTLERRDVDGIELAIRALERADLPPTILEAEGDETMFKGDAALVLQALANLLRNAQEHGNGAKRLAVTGTKQAVEFAVDDEGPGFSEEILDHAFEAFAGQARAQHGSLGLGLSLVRRIAEAHGGIATAKNLDHGARVILTLPRKIP